MAGQGDLAVGHMCKAIELQSGTADYHADLGNILVGLGRFDEAEVRYREVLRLSPDHPRGHNGLGNAVGHLGRFAEAAAHYREALRLSPDSPEPHYNLARALYRLGEFADAASSCREALRLRPDDAEAHDHLGNILSMLGQVAEAERCYREALRLKPNYPEALRNLGDLLVNVHQFELAVPCYRDALLLKPDFAGTWNNLGVALTTLARPDEADKCYGEALRLTPDFLGARVNRCVGRLRVIYRDEPEVEQTRRDYAAELETICRGSSVPTALEATGAVSTFLLAYQGRCDRDLQALYGSFIARVMASLYPAWTSPPAVGSPQQGEAIRVGILSGHFYNHSNWKIPIRGWLSALDKNRFRLFGYHLGLRHDEETELARTLCYRFVQDLTTLEQWAEAIRADRLHVLLIPGIGMDNATLRLAGLRLAPVQATSWGHPETSGLPTIDHYLSSELMEPAEADTHYTERLVRLPNLSIWYAPPTLAPEAVSRAEIGVPDEAVLYWCCQSLFKYLPRYDWVFPRIAAAVRNARFVFIEYPGGDAVTAVFRERLAAAFAKAGLEAEQHCDFLPPMNMERFAGISRIADVFLDSLGWSGCNSTLEALACDLPVVTMAGELMRGRHSAAILTMLGMPDLIADSPEAFCELAAELGRDKARRRALAARIARDKHRLYRDQACIDGLAHYLEKAANRGFAGPSAPAAA
jgi:predicted O-linked N-acetylglucosamine transferase (SPINDLY family)